MLMMKGGDTMKRIPLSKRILPNYCKGEEIMNTVTHIAGGGLGILGALICILHGLGDPLKILTGSIYGFSLITLYTMSSVYHGLRPGMGKKVLQVLDHCMIYLLIAGTYTPIMVCGFLPRYPLIGWGLLLLEWSLGALAATLTAIDLKRWKVFSLLCYILMGWAVIPFASQALAVLGAAGFSFLLAGGIVYTIGAVFFAVGRKLHWMHSVCHIFVVLGSILHLICIAFYVF